LFDKAIPAGNDSLGGNLVSARNGAFVCVVGPSGAGKDTLIRLARERLAEEPGFLFLRRLVTRPQSTFEDHEILSDDDFAHGVRDNRFALHWRAHGLGYAIDRTAFAAMADGIIVICNISRDQIATAQRTFARAKIVLVTATGSAIAARLAARGREAPADIGVRLTRGAACSANFVPDVTIDNSSSPQAAADVLTDFLIQLRRQVDQDQVLVGGHMA
jgi:ribose 1,5-bisphosphokinase